MTFACSALTEADVRGKTVIEAGAFDVNGSVRPHVEALGPASYVATDMRTGPGVDLVCAAEDLPAQFTRADAGTLYRERFDVVISTEMLEHAKDWQAAMRGMISVMRDGALLVLTARSEGFPVHGYPDDHWRFSVGAFGGILAAAGLEVERLEPDPDPQSPGVFARARKPRGWSWPEGVGRAWGKVQVTRP
jgi:SAM-dependent methyltransferase